jgi:hypothetical protein
VGTRRLARAIELARAERVDDPPMVGDVQRASLRRVAASLEVAPRVGRAVRLRSAATIRQMVDAGGLVSNGDYP